MPSLDIVEDLELFYNDFYLQKRPCIIPAELTKHWRVAQWNSQSLKKELGQRAHSFSYSDGGSLIMKISEYIERVFESNPNEAPDLPQAPSKTEKIPYMRHVGPLEGRLYEDIEIENLFPHDISCRKFLFFGVANTKTNCHYDWSHNFSYIVEGKKHVTILPPLSEKYMDNISEKDRKAMSLGDCFYFEDPEGCIEQKMANHPVLSSCPTIYCASLEKGDMVFFPAYWYHYFHNTSPAISVTIQSTDPKEGHPKPPEEYIRFKSPYDGLL